MTQDKEVVGVNRISTETEKQLTEAEKLDNECLQCRDQNCGLYGCMKRPPPNARMLQMASPAMGHL